MKALGRAEFSVSQNVAFNIIGLIYGVLMVWLYAAILVRATAPGRALPSARDWRFGPWEFCCPTQGSCG